MKTTAQYITPAANEWLDNTEKAQVLNVFKNSINLVNSAGLILSIVNPHVERGPFTLIIDNPPSINRISGDWLSNISIRSVVNNTLNSLNIGPLIVDYSEARLWNPRPNWETIKHTNLDAHLASIRKLLSSSGSADSLAVMLDDTYQNEYQLQISLAWPGLCDGLRRQNISQLQNRTERIAGLGPGLTPSGDDFLLGVVFALWVLLRSEETLPLVDILVATAAPRTTSLSAAWLKAAARGEASESWHALIRALGQPATAPVFEASNRIIRTGATSGADALTGLVLGLQSIRQN